MRDGRIQASEEKVARSLEGPWREDVLFELGQVVEGSDFYQRQVAACDQQLQKYLAVLPERKMVKAAGAAVASPQKGEEVTMRMGNLLDQPVSTQHPPLPAHGGAATFALGGVGGLTAVEQPLQISIAESVQVEFTPTHGEQQSIVLAQNAQPADRSALPRCALLRILRQLFQPSRGSPSLMVGSRRRMLPTGVYAWS